MRGLRDKRAYAGAVILVVATTAGTLLSVSPASAEAKAPKQVTCTSLSGNLTATPITFTLGGCSGETGGSGTAQGATISWASGRTTFLTLNAFPLKRVPRAGNCPTGSSRWTVFDSVAGDSTGSLKAGGKVSAKVCIMNNVPDPWSLAPGTVLKLR